MREPETSISFGWQLTIEELQVLSLQSLFTQVTDGNIGDRGPFGAGLACIRIWNPTFVLPQPPLARAPHLSGTHQSALQCAFAATKSNGPREKDTFNLLYQCDLSLKRLRYRHDM
jgi:hypothetical protein